MKQERHTAVGEVQSQLDVKQKAVLAQVKSLKAEVEKQTKKGRRNWKTNWRNWRSPQKSFPSPLMKKETVGGKCMSTIKSLKSGLILATILSQGSRKKLFTISRRWKSFQSATR
eukprot:UN02535